MNQSLRDELRSLKLEFDRASNPPSSLGTDDDGVPSESAEPDPAPAPGSVPVTTMEEDFAAPGRPLRYEPVPFTAPVTGSPFPFPKVNMTTSSVPQTRAPPLQFPKKLPPGQETHHCGRWLLDPVTSHVRWIRYLTVLNHCQLPENVSHEREHWIERRYPDGHYLTQYMDWIPAEFGNDQPRTPYRSHGSPVSKRGLTPSTYRTSAAPTPKEPPRWRLPVLKAPVTTPDKVVSSSAWNQHAVARYLMHGSKPKPHRVHSEPDPPPSGEPSDESSEHPDDEPDDGSHGSSGGEPPDDDGPPPGGGDGGGFGPPDDQGLVASHSRAPTAPQKKRFYLKPSHPGCL